MAAALLSRLNERLCRPGGPPLYFRITNLVVAVLMIVSGIVFFTWSQFERIMLGVFEVLFGLWIIAIELAETSRVGRYVQFMFTWFGRGLFYVVVGCLTLGHKTFGWVFGAIIAGVGVVFIALALTVKRRESYATNPDADRLSGHDVMYDPNSVYGRKLDMYGSAASVQQSMAQPHYASQPHQPQYTTSQYRPSTYNPGQPDPGPYQDQTPTHYQNHQQAASQQQPADSSAQDPATNYLHSSIR
ncbi:hypothetical protein LPJ61_000735 [Coemansia biformis]|uniref:COPI associated n=1 Tax=Coemansia biformis TaxID=1286918 RepID=A0A9W7YHD1_9FUNG|nr:hypothetical protein LPJ61_000735 [Coemansia biformis]